MLFVQPHAAAELCESYPAGTAVTNLDDLEGTYLLSRMGPIDTFHRDKEQEVRFCANLHMCDVSCTIKFKDGRVTEAKYISI